MSHCPSLTLLVSSILCAYCHFLFRLGGAWPLHNVLSLVFWSLTEDPTVIFARAPLTVPLLPTRSCCFILRRHVTLSIPANSVLVWCYEGAVDRLFGGGGKLHWGFTIVLDPCLQLITVSYDQILVHKSVLSFPLAPRSFSVAM
jgi:hypothetical protein